MMHVNKSVCTTVPVLCEHHTIDCCYSTTMSDEASRPRNIPDSQLQCRSSPKEPRENYLFACSQPDRSSLNDTWLMRDSRSVVSLSFRNLYLDDERTIILQQDVEELKDSAQNPDKNAQESTRNECDVTVGDNHRSPVSDEYLCTIKQPSPDLAELSTQCIASQKEMREFYAKEMSEYIMIGSSGSEEKINGHSEMCDPNCMHNIDDVDSSSIIHELSRANSDQIDSPLVRTRMSVSTMNTSSSASSINDMDISQQSSLNASMNSFTSQPSSVTELGGKVHHCEVVASLSRVNMCLGISQISPIDKVKLASFKLYGTKIACYLHYLGLDQDCKPNGSLTLTAILRLPKKKRGIANLLDHKKCTVKLTVGVYEGRVEERNVLVEPRFSLREMDDDDRQRLTMHMTVHDVVRQEAIIFSERRAEKIFFKIKMEICVN